MSGQIQVTTRSTDGQVSEMLLGKELAHNDYKTAVALLKERTK